ncbi:MAG: hypothetical protein U0105_04970 [Candidatus Obscuribacterales bacterium]
MTSGQGGEGQQKSLGTGTLLVGEIGPSGLRGGLLKIVQLTAPAGILQVAGPHSGALFIRGGVIKAASSPEHKLTDMAALAHVLSATAGKYRFSTDLPPVPIPENLNVDLGALLSWHSGGINQQPSLNDALAAIVKNAAMGPDFSADAGRQMLGRPDSPVFADATRGQVPARMRRVRRLHRRGKIRRQSRVAVCRSRRHRICRAPTLSVCRRRSPTTKRSAEKTSRR